MADTEMLEDQLQASDDDMGSAYEPQEGGAMLADEAGPPTFAGGEHSFTAMEDDDDPQETPEAPQEGTAMESDDLETVEPEHPQPPATSSVPLPFASLHAQVSSSNSTQSGPEQSQSALQVSPPAFETAQRPPLTFASQPPTAASSTPVTTLDAAQSWTAEQPAEASEKTAPEEVVRPQTEESDAPAVSAPLQTHTEATDDVQDDQDTLDAPHVQHERPVEEGSEVDPAEQEDPAAQDAPASSESVESCHSSEAESNEDGTQPAPRIDLLQSVEMPASLAPYLEPTDEGHLPTEDNNDLENIRAPPVLLSCAGQTYWLFADMKNDTPASEPEQTATAEGSDVQAPIASTSKASAAEEVQGTEAPAHPVLFAKEHELYYAPLAKVFDHLHDQFSAFQEDQMEIRLCVQELGIEIPEDNAYAGELTIHDLDRLHIGCDLSGRLHIALTEAPRFIYRFNTLARHVAKFASVQPEVDVSHQEDRQKEDGEKADAEEPLLNDNDLTEAVVVDEQVLTGEVPDPEDQDDIAAELQGDEFTDQEEQSTEDQTAEVLDNEEDHLDTLPAQTTADKVLKDAGAPPAGVDPTLAEVTGPVIQDASEEASNGVTPVDPSHGEAVATELADDAPTVQPEELEIAPDANPQVLATDNSSAVQQAKDEFALASDTKRHGISPKRGREEDGELEGSVTPTDPHDAKRVKAG